MHDMLVLAAGAPAVTSPVAKAAIIVVIGLVATLVGFGVVPPLAVAADKRHAWHARWGSRMQLGGPLILLVGLVQLGWALFHG